MTFDLNENDLMNLYCLIYAAQKKNNISENNIKKKKK
jgi:hypothetical protein